MKEANNHWQKLQKLDPEIYRYDYLYAGNKCLFSLCLEKHLKQRHFVKIDKKNTKSQLDQLINLLGSSERPIAKGLAYEAIWGDPPEVLKSPKERHLLYRIETQEE